MLPSPHLRPSQPSEQQRLATYLDAQQLLNNGPTAYLLPPRQPPAFRNNAPILNLYTPYRAHDSAPQIPLTVQQGALQEDLLRRKTPAGTLPDAYDGAPIEWPRRPTKHILLPLSTGMRNGELNNAQNHAGSFQGVQPLAVPIQPIENVVYSGTESWGAPVPDLWTNSGAYPVVNQNGLDFGGLMSQLQPQAVPPQIEQLYSNGVAPSTFSANQQAQQVPYSLDTTIRNNLPVVETGIMPAVRPDGDWYVADNGVLIPRDGHSPMRQQIISSAYQINTPFTPSKFQEFRSFIGHVPTWNQQYRGNSGQAQTPQAINAPVTSPYPITPYQPFVADPIHHAHGGVPIVTNYIQNVLPNRNRVLSWAHKVYADLVQSTQVQHVAQAGHQLLSRPSGRLLPQQTPNDPMTTYQHRLHNPPSSAKIVSRNATPTPTLTPQANDPTEDNFDRRKKRKIESTSEIPTSSSHARRVRRNTASGYSIRGYNNNISLTPLDSSTFRQTVISKGDVQLDAGPYHPTNQFIGRQYGQLHSGNGEVNHELNIHGSALGRSVMVSPAIGINGLGHVIGGTGGVVNPAAAKIAACHALDTLQQLCAESGWRWLDGMLLGGCIAYVRGFSSFFLLHNETDNNIRH